MATALLVPLALAAAQAAAPADDPPSRALSRELTASARLAGTIGSETGARVVARHLEAAGWEVEFDRREVLLSLPRRVEVRLHVKPEYKDAPLVRAATFDPDAIPPGDVPLFNAWSASGRAEGPIVDVGRGLRADYERLAAEGREVAGAVALARYGGAYRGVKARLAEEHGCVGLLLFSDPETTGPGAGTTYHDGPFMPGWDGQRGSILPMELAPGDPSTPGWASPAPGASVRRLTEAELDERLPGIPVAPIGWADAQQVLQRVHVETTTGVARAELVIDQPRDLRPIVNVIARLPGASDEVVIAGNHRDAWVRGAADAGAGTVSLLRAAQHLGARARDEGWTPPRTLVLAFWDAEETGLVGSTEWGEANAAHLRERCVAYVNADAAVSGTRFRGSGTPGMLGVLRDVLDWQPDPADPTRTLLDQWVETSGGPPSLGLPGSGSDFAVFLHHLSLPMIDFGFGGNRGGHYHTAFDDFEVMDRWLDPGWVGHEASGRFVAALLTELATRGRASFDAGEAAATLAAHARAAGAEDWLGELRGDLVADALQLAGASGADGPAFYGALRVEEGLPARPWFKNRALAPGLETGYAAETWPTLRAAAARGDDALDAAVEELVWPLLELASRPLGE